MPRKLFGLIFCTLTLGACTTAISPSTTPEATPSLIPTASVAPSAISTQSTQPTASSSAKVTSQSNWKTYSGTKYSFKYPADWKLIADANHSTLFNPKTVEKSSPARGGGEILTEFITIYMGVSTQPVKQYLDAYLKDNPAYTGRATGRKVVTIAGKPGEMIKEEGEGASGYGFYVYNGEEIIYINTSASTINGPDTAGKILGTLTIK